MCKDKYILTCPLSAPCTYISAVETLVPKQKLAMKIAPVPAYERERLKALNDYHILDTQPESEFDDIAGLAAAVCDVPVAFISFIDANRMWFKSHHGLQITNAESNDIFSAHAINDPSGIFIVNDLSADSSFNNATFVTGGHNAMFYAGMPLLSADGYVVGTLSVMDTEPRTLNDTQTKGLRTLAAQVMNLLELKRKNLELQQKQAELNMAYAALDNIAHLASHDLKSPLNNIISLSDLIKSEFGALLGEDGNEYITYLGKAAYHLSDMISGIQIYVHAAKLPVNDKEPIYIDQVVNEVLAEQNVPEGTVINYTAEGKSIYSDADALKKILQQLLQNAVLYTDKPTNTIDITFAEHADAYTFEIKDNGEGIDEESIPKLFILFRRLKDRPMTPENMGIGVPVASRLAQRLGGKVTVQSQPGIGTTVTLILPK